MQTITMCDCGHQNRQKRASDSAFLIQFVNDCGGARECGEIKI